MKLEEQRKQRYQEESKKRLMDIIEKKIKTTMIGALDSIENNFGFLWNEYSDEAMKMRGVYDKVRNEILDRGNNQIRNIRIELEQYSVEWLRYHMTLPVRPLGGTNEKQN